MSRRWRNLPVRSRQRRFDPPWPLLTSTPGPVAPQLLRQTRRPQLPARRGEFVPLPIAIQVLSAPAAIVPKLSRQAPRSLVLTRRQRFLSVPLAPVVADFVCQDFTTTTTVDAYAATTSVDAYSATVSGDTYSAGLSIDTYSATAVICGR
jgi:hypothetical protein